MKYLISLVILSIVGVAQAAPTKYRFQCYSKEAAIEKVELVLQGRTATLDGLKGRLDSSYSGGSSKTYDRFLGIEGPESHIELLVEKKLRQGASRGRIRTQSRGEGFHIELYQCYSRD
jgi:hypothetical protein